MLIQLDGLRRMQARDAAEKQKSMDLARMAHQRVFASLRQWMTADEVATVEKSIDTNHPQSSQALSAYLARVQVRLGVQSSPHAWAQRKAQGTTA